MMLVAASVSAEFPPSPQHFAGIRTHSAQAHRLVFNMKLHRKLQVNPDWWRFPTALTDELLESAPTASDRTYMQTRVDRNTQQMGESSRYHCCFRLVFGQVILQRVTLNNFDKSLSCTYSKYSPLHGLRARRKQCVCRSVFIILSDIRKLS